VNLIPRFGSIRDQAHRQTCTAFAAVACLELAIRNTAGVVDLSEQFAYWNMVKYTGQHNLVSIFPLLKTGVCLESVWPYYTSEIPGNDAQDPPPPNAVPTAVGYHCKDVLQLPPRDVTAIQQAIAQDRAVAIGIPVYASWKDSAVVRKYGNITVPVQDEVPERIGHAIALVGFQDDANYAGGGYFIVRNSWDSYWAEQSVLGAGYGTIPYLYITNFNWDAWCIV
jgi:C1A family cysteine protease